jgi:hypothetical protein
MAQKVLTGGRCKFFLNNQPLGHAMGVNVTENIAQEPVNVLDDLRPIEYATTGYTVQMRVQLYRVPNEDLVAAGLWPQQGKEPDEMKTLFLGFEPMTAALYDSHTNAYVGKLTGVVPTSRNLNFQARGLIMTDASFLAITYADEGSPQM